jgi:hypothetical protein
LPYPTMQIMLPVFSSPNSVYPNFNVTHFLTT